MILSPVRRTVKLPFYRTIPEIRSDRPTLGSVMSHTPYDLFCVRSQLQVLTPYSYEIESVEDLENDKMKTILSYTALPNDKPSTDDVQSTAEEIISLRSDYYPIWSYRTPFTRYRIWEQNVIVPIVEQKFKSQGPVSVGGALMLSLSGDDRVGDYLDIIEKQTQELQSDIEKALKEGWISCDREFAKRWNFTQHPTFKDIYVMDSRLSKQLELTDVSPCEFLFSVYLYPSDCIVIPIKDGYDDKETQHDISAICQRRGIIPAFLGTTNVVISSKYIDKVDVDLLVDLLSFVPKYDEDREVSLEYVEIEDNETLNRYLKDENSTVYIQLLKNDNKFFISTSNQK